MQKFSEMEHLVVRRFLCMGTNVNTNPFATRS